MGEMRGLSRSLSAIAAIVVVGVVIAAFLAYVVPDLWTESTKAGSRIAESFTPENAARQRACCNVSPRLWSVLQAIRSRNS